MAQLVGTPFAVYLSANGNVYVADGSGNIDALAIDIEDLMAQGAALQAQAANVPITSADSVTTLTSNEGDVELDVRSSGANGVWLFSDDSADTTSNVGIGTGNSSASLTGTVAVYSGDAQSGAFDSGLIGISTGLSAGGTSGNIGLQTGNATAGNSGDIALTTGTAGSTRGRIILDASAIGVQGANPIALSSPSNIDVYVQSSNSTGDDRSGAAWLFSGDTSGSGGTGEAGISSGNTHGATNSGIAWVITGNADLANSGPIEIGSGNATVGDSGHIRLQTGAAGGTRGNITLDAPTIVWTSPMLGTANQTGSTDSVGIDIISGSTVDGNSGQAGIETGTPSGTGNSGTAFLGSANSLAGNVGLVSIYTGDASGAGKNGGDVSFYLGHGGSGARRGLIIIDTLPTADPHVVGALWNSSGVLHVSAG